MYVISVIKSWAIVTNSALLRKNAISEIFFKIDLPRLSKIWYIALCLSFGRIAFEFHDVVNIFHALFQSAMLTPTKLTQCLEEPKYQFRQCIWILTLTVILQLYYSIWFKRNVSFLKCKISVIV